MGRICRMNEEKWWMTVYSLEESDKEIYTLFSQYVFNYCYICEYLARKNMKCST